jgi:hypothetical protein
MARPIKMHEDALLKVMQKSLKPLTMISTGISKALLGSQEQQIEGARKAELLQKNALEQTDTLKEIARLLKDSAMGGGGETTLVKKGVFEKYAGLAKIFVGLNAIIIGIMNIDLVASMNMLKDGLTKLNTMFKETKLKFFTTIREKWTAMKVAIKAPFIPLLNLIDDLTGKSAAAGKEPGKWMQRITKFKEFAKLSGQKLFMRVLPKLFALVGILDSFWAAKEETTDKDDSIFTIIRKKFFAFRKKFVKWFVDDMIVGSIDLVWDILKSMFTEKKFLDDSTDSNFKERFTVWREEFETMIGDWATNTLNAVTNFFKNNIKKLDPRTWFSGDGSSNDSSSPKSNTPSGSDAKKNKIITDTQNSKGTTGDKPGFFGNLKSKVNSGWQGFKSDVDQSFSSSSGPHRPIGDDGGTTNMSGVNWNKLHEDGRRGVESVIWSVYDKYGKTPTFTSGLREKGHAQHNPASQHAYGLALDLRSKDLGSDLPKIRDELSAGFKNAGWFFQHEVKGQMNSTGTAASADHFHMHKAAKGFHGYVDKMTGFIAGEAGRERVDITPMNSPDKNMNNLNTLHRERAMSGMGSPPVSITNVTNQSSNVSSNSVLLPGVIRSKELP